MIGADDGDVAFWGRVTRVHTDPCLVGKKVGAGTTVHDLAARLTALRHMKVSQPEPVTIGGYHGVHLALTAPADLDRCRRGSVTILHRSGRVVAVGRPERDLPRVDPRCATAPASSVGSRISPGAVRHCRARRHGRVSPVHRHRPAVAGATIMCANRTSAGLPRGRLGRLAHGLRGIASAAPSSRRRPGPRRGPAR